MSNVKDKRIIAYKSERAKKIAFNLRRLVIRAVMREWSRLGDEQERIRLECEHEVSNLSDQFEISRLKGEATVKHMDIEDKLSDLYEALNASICICPGCNQANGDMVYNVSLDEWYCSQCVQGYHNFYHKNKAVIDQGGFVGDFDEDFHSSFL